MMRLVLRRSCCKLETAVYALGIILTTLYLVVGLGGVVWFVLCHMEESDVMSKLKELYLLKMETMMDSLAVMGAVLVITFMGLLTCLLLILGVRTEQRLLLLPWQLYHCGVILACFGGGLYQILHFTVLSDGRDSFQAAFALFPFVGGLFFIFIWVLVHQLAIRLRYRRQMDRVIEEKRASLASLHLSLPRHHPPVTPDTTHRSVRSIRTLKRRSAGGRGGRSHSVEHILTEGDGLTGDSYYWVAGAGRGRAQPGDWTAGRSRSLPRHLERGGYRDTAENTRYYSRDFNFDSVSLRQQRQCKTLERDSRSRQLVDSDPITIPKCSTEKMRRRQIMGVSQEEGSRTDTLARRAQSSTLRKSSATTESSGPGLGASLSAGSVKNVTIHPEVTQFSYNHHKPSSKVWRELNLSSSKVHLLSSDPENNEIGRNTVSRRPQHSSDENGHHTQENISPTILSVNQENLNRGENKDLNFLALSDTDTVDLYTVPSPVYPTSSLPRPGSSTMKRRSREQMTRHQIINLYCSSSEERDR